MRVVYANNMAPGVGVVKCLSVCTLKHCRCVYVGVCVKSILSAGFSFLKMLSLFKGKREVWGLKIKVLIKGGINTMLNKCGRVGVAAAVAATVCFKVVD